MTKNIFFDPRKLKHCGKNVIIGQTARIRYPELVSIGDNCIIDDFTYISAGMELGDCVLISSGSRIIGGKDAKVIMKKYVALAPNVVLLAGSDDFNSCITAPLPKEFKGNMKIGTITLNRHCAVGTGSVVFPNITFKEGAALGVLSLAKKDLEEWSVYFGIPAKKISDRNKKQILELERKFDAQR